MSSKPRKPNGSFLNDPSVGNLMQQSPRQDLISFDRSPFTMANHNSKTNFIGESVLPEGPRAVSVSEDGAKHSLLLDGDMLGNGPNLFSPALASAQQSTLSPLTPKPSQIPQIPQMPQTIQQLPQTQQQMPQMQQQMPQPVPSMMNVAPSCTKIPNPADLDRPRIGICTKRNKGSRRYINQKPRPVFTPRHIDRMTPRSQSEDRQLVHESQNFNAQTQTDVTPSSTPLQVTHKYHSSCMPGNHSSPPPQTPVAPPRRFIRENVGDMLTESPRIQPLRVFPTRKKSKIKDYSELRSIVSALTLITVVSWLFSTFFELEGIVEIFTSLVHVVQSWYAKREQPMTKAEMLVQYVRSWLT